jgi:hypothetical protein
LCSVYPLGSAVRVRVSVRRKKWSKANDTTELCRYQLPLMMRFYLPFCLNMVWFGLNA